VHELLCERDNIKVVQRRGLKWTGRDAHIVASTASKMLHLNSWREETTWKT